MSDKTIKVHFGSGCSVYLYNIPIKYHKCITERLHEAYIRGKQERSCEINALLNDDGRYIE